MKKLFLLLVFTPLFGFSQGLGQSIESIISYHKSKPFKINRVKCKELFYIEYNSDLLNIKYYFSTDYYIITKIEKVCDEKIFKNICKTFKEYTKINNHKWFNEVDYYYITISKNTNNFKITYESSFKQF